MKQKIAYWIRMLGFAVITLYVLSVGGFAWLQANAATRPARHEICCVSPHDFGAEYESIIMTTPDDIQLFGWYIPSQNGAAVILFGSRVGTLVYAEMLYSNGYGVLMYDQRASGESEGEMRSWGWQDVADTRVAIDFLRERSDVEFERIGVLGCSTGAEIAIGSGAQYEDIQAVIADGAFWVTADDTWPPYGFMDWIGWPFYPLFIEMVEWNSGVVTPMSLKEAVTQISPRSLFLIAAGENGYEQSRAQQYYERASEPKEYWIVEGASHCGGPNVQPLEYENRIIDFFDRALLSSGE